MKRLIDESPLLILPKLARDLGLAEAILLQQLHFRVGQQGVEMDGEKWYFQTYERWTEQFPFWSAQTVKRLFQKLENQGYIIATPKYNRMKIDRTKWYRIVYQKFNHAPVQSSAAGMVLCHEQKNQQQPTMDQNEAIGIAHQRSFDEFTNDPAITKDVQKERIQEKQLAAWVEEIIQYLNDKTGKSFKCKTKQYQVLIAARLADGYTLEDFKKVIDQQTKRWLHDEERRQFLRPTTLFRATNFDAYLNDALQPRLGESVPQDIVLDFDEGEES